MTNWLALATWIVETLNGEFNGDDVSVVFGVPTQSDADAATIVVADGSWTSEDNWTGSRLDETLRVQLLVAVADAVDDHAEVDFCLIVHSVKDSEFDRRRCGCERSGDRIAEHSALRDGATSTSRRS